MVDGTLFVADKKTRELIPIKLIDNGDGTYSLPSLAVGARVFTSSAASVTTITAAALADVASEYVGQIVIPLGGAMAGEGRYITAYNGTNQLTVSPAWAADPDAGGDIQFAVAPSDSSYPTAQIALVKAETDQIGTIVNTGGTATLAALLGDPANSSLVARLATLAANSAIASGTFTTSSATVPADTGRTEASQYWNGCLLMPTTGACAYQPRLIRVFATTTGIFTLDADMPFTAAPGLVDYIILPGYNGQHLPTADASTNQDTNDVVGNKADAAVTAVGAVASTIAYVKGLLNQAAAVKAQTDLILPGVKLATKTSTSTLTTGTLFNWAGSVQILSIIGRVTTQIQNQATTIKLGIQADALTLQDICATVDANNFLVGTMLGITGSYTDAMVGTTGVPTKPPMTPVNATCVTSGIIKVTYGAASSGAIVWEILWCPLNAAGSITAA